MFDAVMPTILLVENDADTRRIYADVLSPIHGRVLEASPDKTTGQQACDGKG